MGRINKVCIDDSGNVWGNHSKKVRPRKKERFNKNEQPVSRSQDIEEAGVFKGARVMSATTKEDRTSFRHCVYKETDESPNPKYDGRVHPHFR